MQKSSIRQGNTEAATSELWDVMNHLQVPLNEVRRMKCQPLAINFNADTANVNNAVITEHYISHDHHSTL